MQRCGHGRDDLIGIGCSVVSDLLDDRIAKHQSLGELYRSVAGLRGGHPNLLYATSRGGIAQMTRAMVANHGPDGVRVNCVAQSMVYTPMVYGRGMSEELREKRRKGSLLQVEGTGWDVGTAVVKLTSEQAR